MANTIHALMFTAESQKGHARYTRDLLSAMATVGKDRGISTELVTGSDLSPIYLSEQYPIHPILPPIVDRGTFKTRLSWSLSRVSHYLRRERVFLRYIESRPDIRLVHLQEYTPWLATTHFPRLRRAGVDVVMTVHNIANYGHSSRTYMKAMKGTWRRARRACSALIVHTEGLRDELAEDLGLGHPPIHVTPHAVWEERSTSPVASTPPRSGEPARLLFFGMVRPNKGLHVLLRAMEELPSCRLTIAGEHEDPSYRAEIHRLIARLPSGSVEMIDKFIDENEIAGYFDRSHLVILPYTDFASQSGVLHQALAHARPVVASDVGGLGESVRSWGIGQVVLPKDEHSLASGILSVLGLENYLAASEATHRVREQLTWANMAEATCDVYRSLVD